MSEEIITVLQLSDTHLFATESGNLLGLNTLNSFTAVLQQIKKDQRRPDLVLLTGDLAQDESAAAYQRLAASVEFFNCPTYWIPGNHDAPAIMADVFKKTQLNSGKEILFKQWQIILLDSCKPGVAEGLLAASQLMHLQQCLQNSQGRSTLIVLHHHVLPIDCAWLDKFNLENADVFLKMIKPQQQVKGVLCGHIHQAFEKMREGVFYFSAPSTCFQFLPKSKKFTLDPIAPGYRWIELNPDGTLKSEVKRVAGFEPMIDPHAKGY